MFLFIQSSANLSPYSAVFQFNHTFEDHGNYSITLTCSNSLNSQNVSTYVAVELDLESVISINVAPYTPTNVPLGNDSD